MKGPERRHAQRARERTTREDLETRVLELANRVRVVEGRPMLADMPVGDYGDPEHCSLAKALEATVGYVVIRVDSQARARAIARALGVTFADWREDDGISWIDNGEVAQEIAVWPSERWCVPMPAAFREFVRGFDHGLFKHLERTQTEEAL